MNEREIAALAKGLMPVVQEMIHAANADVFKRIDALEARQPERGEKGERGDVGEAGPIGRDGVGLAGALIDRSGVLVLTLTDGTTRELGMVVGKDGADAVSPMPDEDVSARVQSLIASCDS